MLCYNCILPKQNKTCMFVSCHLRLSHDATLLVTGLPPLSLGLYVQQHNKKSGTAHAPGQDSSSMFSCWGGGHCSKLASGPQDDLN